MGEKMAEEEFPNTTHEGFNVTLHTTLVVTTKLVLPTPAKPILPVQTGEQAQQEEQSSGMTIFFSLLVLAICIILVHLLIRYRLHFLPESVAVVSLGILMGAVIKIIEFKKLANWKLCIWLPDFCCGSSGHYCYFQCTSCGPSAQHAGVWREYSQRRRLHCPDQVLVLFARAVNIFPLSYLLNFFRDHKITPKMMFIMWFSGLRGAIPYALSLHLDLEPMEKRQLIGTTTIIIVLFTILLLGGSTMPLIRLMDIEDAKARRRNKKDVNLSKTEKMGNTIESEHLSELTEEEYEAHYIRRQDLKGFVWLDAKYLNPFFTRRLTQEDLHHGRIQMKTLTNKWYEEVRQGPSGSEDDEQELL
uniref:Solute carrier family 9 member A8 n=1 Tax=Panthera leo TaxID=9689 RepID=A0A8C8WIB2_PANLE